jgi:hypothetical protein
LLYNISFGIKLLLKKSEENSKTKKKKIKKGEQDDNTIAQAAASSLLALVNGLDEMQIHMSKLITEQEGKVETSKKRILRSSIRWRQKVGKMNLHLQAHQKRTHSQHQQV